MEIAVKISSNFLLEPSYNTFHRLMHFYVQSGESINLRTHGFQSSHIKIFMREHRTRERRIRIARFNYSLQLRLQMSESVYDFTQKTRNFGEHRLNCRQFVPVPASGGVVDEPPQPVDCICNYS